MRNILIVDDHPVVLEVMTATAQKAFPGASVLVAEDMRKAEQLIAATAQPLDLVLLDLGLPDCCGISALTRFRALAPDIPVVVFSAMDERDVVVAALNAGATGYIPKTSKPPVIVAALHVIAAGGVYFPPTELSASAEPQFAKKSLTERQLDVLRLITRGLANKQIAKQLRIAENTVKQHAKAAFAALGVNNRTQVLTAADRKGIDLN